MSAPATARRTVGLVFSTFSMVVVVPPFSVRLSSWTEPGSAALSLSAYRPTNVSQNPQCAPFGQESPSATYEYRALEWLVAVEFLTGLRVGPDAAALGLASDEHAVRAVETMAVMARVSARSLRIDVFMQPALRRPVSKPVASGIRLVFAAGA